VNESFSERPIIYSPYTYRARHRELSDEKPPINRIAESRRRSELITTVPKPQKRRTSPAQGNWVSAPVTGKQEDRRPAYIAYLTL
jgi:type III restriction enzyme